MSHLISHQKHKFNIKFILNPSPNPCPLLTHTLPKSCWHQSKQALNTHMHTLRCVDGVWACTHPHINQTLEEKSRIDRHYTGWRRKKDEGNIKYHNCVWVKHLISSRTADYSWQVKMFPLSWVFSSEWYMKHFYLRWQIIYFFPKGFLIIFQSSLKQFKFQTLCEMSYEHLIFYILTLRWSFTYLIFLSQLIGISWQSKPYIRTSLSSRYPNQINAILMKQKYTELLCWNLWNMHQP